MAGSRLIPKWLKSHLDLEGAQKIEQAVIQAELTTEAEIVPMIVKSSSTKGLLTSTLFLILFLLIPYISRQGLDFPSKNILLWLGYVIGLLLIANLLSRLHWIQRGFIPKNDQIANVEHRAVYEFHQRKIGKTHNQTGVLIFVSLMEHRAVILAEGDIMENVEKDLWQKAIDELLFHTKNERLAQGFEEAIKICTARLSEVSPAKQDNPNQIPNHLVIED